MEDEKLFNEIRAIIAEIIEVEEEEIRGDSIFGEELEVDSVKALEIMVEIEKKYGITVDEDRLKDIKNLNDTIALTKEYLQAQGKG
jgi:acyl carrier protein